MGFARSASSTWSPRSNALIVFAPGMLILPAPQAVDDLARRVLQIGQMCGGELFHGERRSDPENVDRAVRALAVRQRNHNCRQPVIARWAIIRSPNVGRVACCVSPAACLIENPFELFWLTREPIPRVLGFPQPPQDVFPLLVGAPGEISPSESCHQPSNPPTNILIPIGWEDEGAVRPACFAFLHVIASGHEQVGWPLHLLAQTSQDGSRCLSHTIVPIALSDRVGVPAETIVAISQTLGDQTCSIQRMQDSQ